MNGDNSVRKTGGELLAGVLAQAGVKKVFGLHGGHLEAFYKGCVDQDIELVDFRHESSAGHAAEAYARVTGGLGVCVVTAGPGFANAMSAIANAFTDRAPVLFIIGAPPLRELETNPLQGGFDQIAMATPVTKWAFRITHTERIPDQVALAVRKALNGPRGPVLLELPVDVLHMSVPAEVATRPTFMGTVSRPAPAPQELARMVALLRAASRPAIVVGGEARFSDCGEALRRFAEAAHIPVFWDRRGAGVLPGRHPLAAGASTLFATAPSRPDLVLMLGARMGMFEGGRGRMVLPADATLVHVHSDAAEIGRLHAVAEGVVADVRSTLEALADVAGGWPDWQAWTRAATALAAAQRAALAMFPKQVDGLPHPHHACMEVVRVAGDEAVYVLDGGEAGMWPDPLVRVQAPGHLMGHGYLGCLGIGPGMAIGAALADPGRRVVQVTGDGAFGFHLQELDTMRRFGLPVLTLVLNNRKWGMSHHGQQMILGPDRRYEVMTRLGDTSYAQIARGFGCFGETVTRLEDVAPATERALASGLPSVVEVMTPPDVAHPVTGLMVGSVQEGSGDVLIPYYENIPAAR